MYTQLRNKTQTKISNNIKQEFKIRKKACKIRNKLDIFIFANMKYNKKKVLTKLL